MRQVILTCVPHIRAPIELLRRRKYGQVRAHFPSEWPSPNRSSRRWAGSEKLRQEPYRDVLSDECVGQLWGVEEMVVES